MLTEIKILRPVEIVGLTPGMSKQALYIVRREQGAMRRRNSPAPNTEAKQVSRVHMLARLPIS